MSKVEILDGSSALRLLMELSKIPGGYTYSGACSYQVCFPLKAGGELRLSVVDDDVLAEDIPSFGIDLYDGALSGICVTGPVTRTGDNNVQG